MLQLEDKDLQTFYSKRKHETIFLPTILTKERHTKSHL